MTEVSRDGHRTDLDAIAVSEPALCIPRVTAVVDPVAVRAIFEQVFGKNVGKISISPRTDKNGITGSRIFVNLTRWPRNERVDALRQLVLRGGSIKIVHAYPMFWKCYQSRPRGVPRGWVGGVIDDGAA